MGIILTLPGQPTACPGWRISPQTFGPPFIEGPFFLEAFRVPLRHRRPSHPHPAQIYAEEAARLRNLAVSVTTAALRSRLLEDADHQERLAQAIKPSVGRPYRPTTARDADFVVTGERR
jgi:hypothetical protein